MVKGTITKYVNEVVGKEWKKGRMYEKERKGTNMTGGQKGLYEWKGNK